MISTIPVWIIFISSILNIEKTNIFQILGVILSLTGVVFIITKAYLNLIKVPPIVGEEHPVVSGKEIGSLIIFLIAKKANACDSTKSPSTP